MKPHDQLPDRRLAGLGDIRQTIYVGLLLMALGGAWMLLGRTWIPDWSVSRGYARIGGIPIWTFGMDLVIPGAAFAIMAPFPAGRDWLYRHPQVLIGLAIAAVIGWLVVCEFAGFLPD